MSPVDFKKMPMSDVSIAYLYPCRMSNLMNNPVGCRYNYFWKLCCMSIIPKSHVEFKKWPCRSVDFRGQEPRSGSAELLVAFPQ